MHLDVSTGGELAVALAAGVDPATARVHGNNKSDEELEHAPRRPVSHRIVVDSFDEIDRLRALARRRRRSPLGVLVRVTPGVEAHTHEYVMTGQEDTKFGFSLASGAAERAVEACRRTWRAPTSWASTPT